MNQYEKLAAAIEKGSDGRTQTVGTVALVNSEDNAIPLCCVLGAALIGLLGEKEVLERHRYMHGINTEDALEALKADFPEIEEEVASPTNGSPWARDAVRDILWRLNDCGESFSNITAWLRSLPPLEDTNV